jgi:RHS repeat-associated protein
VNQLTSVVSNKGTTPLADYRYTLGASGQRLKVTELNGRTVTYAYENIYRLVSETISNVSTTTGSTPNNGNGNVNYSYDAVGNRVARQSTIAAVTSETTINYDNNDRLVADSYDNNGNTIESQGRKYGYGGEQWDADLGLYYNRTRYLDVDQGRFWTSDSFEGEIEELLSLHKYLYAGLDPINKIDPSGNSFVEKGTTLAAKGVLTTGNIIGRVVPVIYLASLKSVFFLFANATKIEFYTDLSFLASLFIEISTSAMLDNFDKIEFARPKEQGNPGEWVERKIGANAVDYQVIDDFREGNATSIKTVSGISETASLRSIEKHASDLRKLKNIIPKPDKPELPIIEACKVTAKTLFVVIPENQSDYLRSARFVSKIRNIQSNNSIILRIVTLRGWNPSGPKIGGK